MSKKANFMVDKCAYIDFYRRWIKFAEALWADKKRLNYAADVWYNKDRNKIAQAMVSNQARGKRVLALGASLWVDAEFLTALGAKEVLRTDLVMSEGIDKLVDACHLPFDDESWDCIVCRELIEHVLDEDALLKEVYRTLKPGGLFFVETANCFNVIPDGIEHLRGYTPESLLAELKEHGFKVIDKKGNVPNIFHTLLPRSNVREVLPEFKRIASLMENCGHSYYIGTILFVLAVK